MSQSQNPEIVEEQDEDVEGHRLANAEDDADDVEGHRIADSAPGLVSGALSPDDKTQS